MISFGRAWDDASPVDYAAALASCTDGELSFLAEHSISLAAVQDDGIAEFGEALYRGIDRERLLSAIADRGRPGPVRRHRPPPAGGDVTGDITPFRAPKCGTCADPRETNQLRGKARRARHAERPDRKRASPRAMSRPNPRYR